MALTFTIVLLARVAAADSLAITVTTTPNGGSYAPKHVTVVWIEDAAGTFVKTIGRWSNQRTSHLVAWIAKSGQDADAVSGATIANHTNPLTLTWDLKNKAGTIVPDGTYTIRMELADSNSTQAAQNHEGTFTFTKGATGSVQSNQTNGGFTNTTITFTSSASCNNGVLDPGEACDGTSCPTSCAATADACMPMVLSGAAATCDAVCSVQAITTCVGGDGCCAAGCTEANDSDCGGGGSNGGTSNSVTGGCATSSPDASWMLLAAVGILFVRRRRR